MARKPAIRDLEQLLESADRIAVDLYLRVANRVFKTNAGDGVSLLTMRDGIGLQTGGVR